MNSSIHIGVLERQANLHYNEASVPSVQLIKLSITAHRLCSIAILCVDSTPPVPTMPNPSPADAEFSVLASSTAISEPRHTLADDDDSLSFPDKGENHGLCVNRTWVDNHASLLHTKRGPYVSVHRPGQGRG